MNNNMERFTIEKSPDKVLQWICIDHESGLICTFEDGKFCDKKVFTFFGERLPDYLTMKNWETKMKNWLIDNHHDKFGFNAN